VTPRPPIGNRQSSIGNLTKQESPMSTATIDQATQLRSLVREVVSPPAAATPAASPPAAPPPAPGARPRATVIAITSGKGGVGKSNVAVNLAIKLASAGKRVILLDADLGLANADVLCNVDVPCNLAHVIARKRELAEVMVTAPGGFQLVAGASGLARMADLSDADRQRLIEALGQLEQQADIILIDTGAGISPNVLSFTRAADHVLVVTTPEPTAITDAYAVVKVISKRDAGGAEAPPRRVSLLVNQARTPGEGRVVHDRIARVAKQFLGVSVLDAGFILRDEEVPTAVRRRTPFVIGSPRCPAAQCVTQLAIRLEQGVAGRLEAGGFFTRMSRWFRK
jgi:flagellar biosynthesis protein FlhG